MADRLIRPVDLRRSWLFVEAGDEDALVMAGESGADLLMMEFEDFTPPARRPLARSLCVETLRRWRAEGAVVGARVNPLWTDDGPEDLEAVMAAAPDIVAIPKVSEPAHVAEFDEAITRSEAANGLAPGSVEILPNIESAAGLIRTGEIARASQRVGACLVASEGMAADLGAERGRDGRELSYVRERFLIECVAAGVTAVDCPYTWTDAEGVRAEALEARRLGYKAKSCVKSEHAGIINKALSPSLEDSGKARRVVAAFEAAQQSGESRVELDGSLVEIPIYLNAKRLVARAEALAEFGGDGS